MLRYALATRGKKASVRAATNVVRRPCGVSVTLSPRYQCQNVLTYLTAVLKLSRIQVRNCPESVVHRRDSQLPTSDGRVVCLARRRVDVPRRVGQRCVGKAVGLLNNSPSAFDGRDRPT